MLYFIGVLKHLPAPRILPPGAGISSGGPPLAVNSKNMLIIHPTSNCLKVTYVSYALVNKILDQDTEPIHCAFLENIILYLKIFIHQNTCQSNFDFIQKQYTDIV